MLTLATDSSMTLVQGKQRTRNDIKALQRSENLIDYTYYVRCPNPVVFLTSIKNYPIL